MMLPLNLETTFMTQAEYCDLVVYPISPTTNIPSTYPMIDRNTEKIRAITMGGLSCAVCTIYYLL